MYVPDSDRVTGGYNRVAIIEAEDEKSALLQATTKYHAKAIVKKIK